MGRSTSTAMIERTIDANNFQGWIAMDLPTLPFPLLIFTQGQRRHLRLQVTKISNVIVRECNDVQLIQTRTDH